MKYSDVYQKLKPETQHFDSFWENSNWSGFPKKCGFLSFGHIETTGQYVLPFGLRSLLFRESLKVTLQFIFAIGVGFSLRASRCTMSKSFKTFNVATVSKKFYVINLHLIK